MTLIAIGGAEDKENEMTLLRRVLHEAPGSNVQIITTATAYPEEVRQKYQAAFAALNVDQFSAHHVQDRDAANDPALLARLDKADIVFLTGGDQLRLTSVFGGTPVQEYLMQREKTGLVVAGTSAGAAVMAALMIYGGASENAGRKGEVLATCGFGLVPGSVIDTHFSERGRLPRLFNLVATNPVNLGIGLDEDTALIIKGDRMEVAGRGTVTFVDGSALKTDIAEVERGTLFSAEGFKVSVLRSGASFDLAKRGVRLA